MSTLPAGPASPLGRRDTEYEYFRKSSSDWSSSRTAQHEGDVLPRLEKLAQEY
jgi:hypothetical protein